MSESLSLLKAFEFGGVTFLAKRHASDMCGSNGLPLTPNSITIYGRSQILKTLEHANLCRYVDVLRSKHERMIVVSELWGTPLSTLIEQGRQFHYDQIIRMAYQILSALDYLHKRNMITRNLSPTTIFIDDNLFIKLFNYALYYITANGTLVSFVVGDVKYFSPEIILAGPNAGNFGAKTDIWSLGVLLSEMCLNIKIWHDLKVTQSLRKIISLSDISTSVFERLAREHNAIDKFNEIPANLVELIENCLHLDATKRMTAAQLMDLAIFDELKKGQQMSVNGKAKLCAPFELSDLYYWWQLTGGDAYSELKKHGAIQNYPPILNIASLVILNGEILGEERKLEAQFVQKASPINLDALYKRFEHMSLKAFYPLIRCRNELIDKQEPVPYEANHLPLIIREKDPEYQFHRTILYKRLLKGYPATKHLILAEARNDICPLYRGDIWAAMLNVSGNIQNIYERIDKDSPTSTDRQIDVDIPRCHQYNELLSSNTGHTKLKRILKAWVVSHPEYVYWQGLDSLTAPFLFLNFNNEAKAYACLEAFVPKYLHKFFLRDNSCVIQEYLAKFAQLITFHDPHLANHLKRIAFLPELFAIPWFLTMFSHVFPIHKILHLWDKLLLGESSFPLYIGLSVLEQLRNTLLQSGFNECIFLFSDLPEIDIETCVARSLQRYQASPPSITHRQFQNGDCTPTNLDISGVELSELQNEICPRISANDLLLLLNTDRVLLVDIRSVTQYNNASLEQSVNVPVNEQTLTAKSLEFVNDLQDNGQQYKAVVVISSDHVQAVNFASNLVANNVHHVCILHGGINVLYSVTPSVLITRLKLY